MIRRWLSHSLTFPIFLVLGLVIRILMVSFISLLGSEGIVDDAYTYHWLSLHWQNFDAFWPPGLSFWLSLSSWLAPDSFLLPRMSMIFWFLVLVWWMRRWLNEKGYPIAANLSVFLIAVYPGLAYHSVEMLTHFPAGVLMFVIFTRLTKEGPGGWKDVALGGGLLSWLILIRPSAILLLVVVPLIWRMRGKSLKGMIAIPLITFIPILIWSNWVSSNSGYPVFINSSGGYNLFIGNNEWTPDYRTWEQGSHWEGEPWMVDGFNQKLDSIQALAPSDRENAFVLEAKDHIFQEPGRFVWQSMNRFRCFWAFDSFSGATFIQRFQWPGFIGYGTLGLDALCWLIILISFGGFGLVFKGDHNAMGYRAAAILILAYALPYFFAFSHPTYHLPVCLLCIPFASIFLRDLINRKLKRKDIGKRRMVIGLIFLLIVMVIQGEWAIRMYLQL